MPKDQANPSARRRFVGAQSPLRAVAEALVAEAPLAFGRIDLSDDLIVVPGGRARRALLFQLAAAATRRNASLCPPRVIGLTQLVETLVEVPPRAVASPTTMLFAFQAGLAQVNGSPPSIGQATDALRVHRELASAGVSFARAADAAGALGADGDRYLALGRAAAVAQQRLSELGLDDPDAESANAVSLGPIRGVVHAIGVVELTARQRGLFSALGSRLVVWSAADAQHASRFDALGALLLSAWEDVEAEIDLQTIQQVDGPMDQAELAAPLLAELARARAGVPAVDDVVIALADPELASVVLRELRARSIGVHDARGVAVAALPPARLLARLREFMLEPTTRSLRRLATLAELEPILGTSAVAEFDKWRRQHHERDIDVDWLDGEAMHAAREHVSELDARLRALAARLPKRGRLDEFLAPLMGVVEAVFLRGAVGDDRGLVDAAITSLRELLERCASVPSELLLETDAVGALDTVLSLLRGERVREIPRDDELDVLGWLELPLDSATSVLVLGMNDGAVPASLDDAWLPDTMRRRLGLPDARARLARDRYVLATLLERAELRFVFQRRDARGEPCTPSALLLSGRGESLARRVRAMTAHPPPPPSLAIMPSRFAPPIPPSSVSLQKLAVTGFARYLQCPYRFWLEHIVGLRSVAPAGASLDEAAFGTVVHRVLQRFGAHVPSRELRDATAIERALTAQLDIVLHERAGPRLGGGLRIQRRILSERLGWFARTQAESVEQGWRIRAVEFEIAGELEIPDDSPVLVHGSIDRIDVHADGRLRIIDYKTGANGDKPDAAHKKGDRWLDLQLPLYRYLHGLPDGVPAIELGYWQIGLTADQVGWREATEIRDAIDGAVATAVEIVQKIRAGELAPNPDYHVRDDSDPLEILCRTANQLGDDESAGEEDDDDATGAEA